MPVPRSEELRLLFHKAAIPQSLGSRLIVATTGHPRDATSSATMVPRGGRFVPFTTPSTGGRAHAGAFAAHFVEVHVDPDRGLLALELKELTFNLDFKVELTGFHAGELDILLGNDENADDEIDEQAEIDNTKPAVTRLGDLWRVGRHFVLCGDATKAESYERLLNGERAQMVFTDPPYNVPIDGHVCGLGKVKHQDFEMASGEMSPAEFAEFLGKIFKNLAGHSVDGSLHYVCMDWRHIGEVLQAGAGSYAEFKNLCVWNKTNGGMGNRTTARITTSTGSRRSNDW